MKEYAFIGRVHRSNIEKRKDKVIKDIASGIIRSMDIEDFEKYFDVKINNNPNHLTPWDIHHVEVDIRLRYPVK